jgi:hypothetical protein
VLVAAGSDYASSTSIWRTGFERCHAPSFGLEASDPEGPEANTAKKSLRPLRHSSRALNPRRKTEGLFLALSGPSAIPALTFAADGKRTSAVAVARLRTMPQDISPRRPCASAS